MYAGTAICRQKGRDDGEHSITTARDDDRHRRECACDRDALSAGESYPAFLA